MLAAFRALAKSWFAAVLMGVLIVAFAVWGIRDVFGGRISDAVIKAGSRTVTSADFKRDFDRIKQQYEQQSGQPLSNEVAAENGLDRRILEELASREALAEMLIRMGIHPSDKLIVGEIEKIQAFFDPVSGRFDKTAYQRRLAENGLSVPTFEGMIRDEVAEQHFFSGVASGLMVPRAYTALAAIYGLEARDIAVLTVGPQNVQQPGPPTDAQLTAFMQENAQALMRPEFRALTIVRFSPDQVNPGPIDPAEVKKRYDFKKDTLSKPETRTVVQIPAKDQASATQIAARLGKGEAPAAVAKAFGVEPITYADKPQTAILDRKLAAAAFQMKAGQTSVVQGDLGLAVVRVDQVTPGHTVTFEEARPAIEAEVRKDAAASKIDALTQTYDDAHTKGATLPEAAQKAGVPVTTIPPVAKQGLDQQGKPVAGLSQKILETAFSLPSGGESELVDAGNGEYFAVRVDKVIPPAVPPLADIKPALTQEWMRREILSRMQAKADELAGRVRKGESLDAVAASIGAKVAHLSGVSRQTASQDQNAPREILGHAFASKVGEVFTATDPRMGAVVGRVERIEPGDPAMVARTVEGVRPQLSMGYFQELQQAAATAAREKVKVRIDAARARAALGLEPEQPKAGGKPGPAK